MTNQSIPFRVHYLNVQRHRPLTQAIDAGIALLAPYAARIESCDVHVGLWLQHHDVARTYRVTLELEPSPGALPLSVERESERNPLRAALLQLVHEAFERVARRLAAREQHAAYAAPPMLSSGARRLHPLHGLAPDELQHRGD